MSDAATLDATPATETAWMGSEPTERPVKAETTPATVGAQADAVTTAAASDPQRQESSEPSKEVAFTTASGDEVKFTSKARREMQSRIDKLTARATAAEAKLLAGAKVEPVAATTTEAKPAATTTTTEGFPEAEPDQDALLADGIAKGMKDPYAWANRQLAAWDRRKEAWEAAQVAKGQAAVTQSFQEREATFAESLKTFKAEHPDYDEVVKAAAEATKHVTASPVLLEAIGRHDNRAAIVYHLAQHPEVLLDLVLLTKHLPAVESEVPDVIARLDLLRLDSVSRGSETETPVRTTTAPPPAGRLGAGTRTTTERAVELAAKGGEDFDASGYSARRREERRSR